MIAVRATLLCVLATVVQLAVFDQVRIAGVAPDLLALVAVLAGLHGGVGRGWIVAFGAGLLWDAYLPTPIGLAALSYALVALAVGSAGGGMYNQSRIQLAALAGAASAVAVGGYALLAAVVGESGIVDLHLLTVLLVVAVTNGLLSFAVAPLVGWVFGSEPERRSNVTSKLTLR